MYACVERRPVLSLYIEDVDHGGIQGRGVYELTVGDHGSWRQCLARSPRAPRRAHTRHTGMVGALLKTSKNDFARVDAVRGKGR